MKAINDKDGEEVDEKDRDLNKSNDEDKEGVSLDNEHSDSGTNDASFPNSRRRHRRTRIKRASLVTKMVIGNVEDDEYSGSSRSRRLTQRPVHDGDRSDSKIVVQVPQILWLIVQIRLRGVYQLQDRLV